jgi:glyoxalase family protein
MAKQIAGIHHVTAIASDPQMNLNFYVGVLGLRLVKRTVNFDDPPNYHLYYGDRTGRPGSLLTFFPWPGAKRGARGIGQVTVTSLAVPKGSLGFWTERFDAYDVEYGHGSERGDTLVFFDRDGLMIELVEGDVASRFEPHGTIPPEYAIRGVRGFTMTVDTEATSIFLEDTLRLKPGGDSRFHVRKRGIVLVQQSESTGSGSVMAGTVHHVAWRCKSYRALKEWRTEIEHAGYNVTKIMDRKYFRSIYFREPGGVLFEIATDGPGFTVDEPEEELGAGLMLPNSLEARRAALSRLLPTVEVPTP